MAEQWGYQLAEQRKRLGFTQAGCLRVVIEVNPPVHAFLHLRGALFPLGSRRETAGESGAVDCHGQFAGRPDDPEQLQQRGAQIGDRLFSRSAIADRSNARTEQGGGTPGAILILLDYVGDVRDLNHAYSIARRESSTHEHRNDRCGGVKCLPFRRPRAGFVLRDADGAPYLITNRHAVRGRTASKPRERAHLSRSPRSAPGLPHHSCGNTCALPHS
jgi:hypothetical protein